MTTRPEQETIIRWDQDDREATLYTANPAQARRWQRLGYDVEVTDRDRQGAPRGWTAVAEADAIRFRRVKAGRVVRRQTGHAGQFRRVQGVSGDQTRVSTG